MNPGEAAVILVAIVFLSPAAIVAVILRHRERMAALRNRQEGSPGLLEAVRVLREELGQLRETTTSFDMSFDAALQRVESRLDTVEQAPGIVEEATFDRYSTYGARTNEDETTVTLRR